MKPFAFLFALLMLVASSPSARAQSTQTAQTSPRLAATVERTGNQFRLALTNLSETRTFEGTASVSLDTSGDAAVRLTFTLAPGETRRLPLFGSKPSSNQYTLTIHDQAGALIFYKIAPISPSAGSESETPRTVQLPTGSGIKVNARLARNLASEAELRSPDEVEASLLTFVIESATPIKDASFTLSGGSFKQSRMVNVQGHAEIEFKLPVALGERRFGYTLTAVNGGLLARGEIDLDKLAAPDAVTVSEMTFDRAVYAPGEAARAIIELQGDAPRGYRLEVTVRENGGASLFKDERKGINIAGKSRQEFLFDLPQEVKGPITIAFQVFGGQTGLLFDSGVREIILNEAPPTRASDGKRLAP